MTAIEILLIAAIVLQSVATIIAILLINQTKFNVLWICCIIGFSLLTVERVFQLLAYDGVDVPRTIFIWLGICISLSFSIGVLFANVLIRYIDRINLNRRLLENRLMTAVLRTEERSRANFSRELHDGLGPLLSSAKMSLSAMSAHDEAYDRKELIDNTMYVIDEAIRSLREISNNLSPHVLNNFGLARGIQNFIDKSCTMHSTKIVFTTNMRSERFDSNIEVILYRVVCELINNSLKHSGCTRIGISLALSGDELRLHFEDNGRGFSPREMIECGMGLSNINSRIGSLNGSFDIDSRDGEGMRADICVNIDSAIVHSLPRRRDKIKHKRENGEN
ncbi:MAG: ATP-binding protein [Alistipes sp.]|nr:ATP-binding protein [Alistipes sp.]MDE6861775.1 ATP-binding protein [Alistipes sp.]MDE7128850.1 ATP-binding protein [Alistipes sp.]